MIIFIKNFGDEAGQALCWHSGIKISLMKRNISEDKEKNYKASPPRHSKKNLEYKQQTELPQHTQSTVIEKLCHLNRIGTVVMPKLLRVEGNGCTFKGSTSATFDFPPFCMSYDFEGKLHVSGTDKSCFLL